MIILANVVLPSVAEHVIIMLVLLVPITLIEAVVIMRRHLLRYMESFKLSLCANLRSTLIGLPLGYIFAILGIIPAGLFAMLLPKNIESAIGVILGNVVLHGGTIPNKLDEIGFYIGTLLVMIPYFIITLRIERKVIVKKKTELDTPVLTKTVWIMNGITYGLLVIPVAVGTIHAAIKFMSTNSIFLLPMLDHSCKIF